MASNGSSGNQNENAGFIKSIYQLGSLWEDHNNEQSRKQPGKINQPLYYFNNMSKRTWKRSIPNVPENIEEEKDNKEVENQIETVKKMIQFISDCGFPITQVNGQRKLGPPPNWTGPPPDPESEVFVGKIPRDLYEDEIFPVFVKMGEIYEIRLMMDFSGNNRGYCFVMYTKPEYAKRAIKELSNYEIRPGHRIGVVASINNCRLCVNHLPPNLNVETFIKKIYEITDNVAKVSVYRYQDGRIKNAIILYKTHIGAAMARRRLVPDRTNFFKGTELSVDWACPNVNVQNVIEESGVLDEDGQVKITKTNLCINKRSRRNSYRSDTANGDMSLNSKDKEAFEEDSGRSSRNSMRSNFSGRQKREKFVHFRNHSNKQRAMSENDLRKSNLNLSLRPVSKQSIMAKMRGSHSSLNSIHNNNNNRNSRNYRSNMDLSKTSSNYHNYPETTNILNRPFFNQENNLRNAMNYQPMYLSNPAISASLQNLSFNNNRIGSSSMMNLNSQSSLRDGINKDKCLSVENISQFFNNYLNLEPGPNYAGNGLLSSMVNNGFNHNYGLMSNGNNRMTNGNSYVQPNFPNPNWNLGQQNNFENMNKTGHVEIPNNSGSFINHNQMPNYYPGVVNNNQYYNAIPMPSDIGISFNDNCCENNQNFLNNINGIKPFYNFCNNENTQRITLNNMGVTCMPKYDTKAFGLGKMKPNFQQYPRPILNRNLSENVK
ncbi:GATA zinc finger domain-containing protein 14-like [Chelonus insularis]|uniref:GATA zinc finger domain-containing protein 14-like n=1 Tax=Chelonus insularis TaxID=460826 RepID=UPI00158CFB12|nr:GATA zinc finger domain-containing protein 14-like [Chelonus insularis]